MNDDAAFDPGRLRLARELQTLSQAKLADAAGLTAAAISQFEAGVTKPSRGTQIQLAETLGVPPAFFGVPLAESHEGFFRSLRKTSIAQRRRARALAHVAHDVAGSAPAGTFPAVNLPLLPVNLDAGRDDLEELAGQVRRAWGMAKGPVSDVVGTLEDNGLLVIRLPLDSADVDAFSLPFEDHPIVVLGAEKNDRARSRFDAAHELGHLVMHGEQVWGVKEVEDQAHQFAAAFLMPRDDIFDALPSKADWPLLFKLKQEWQVSIAALLMRARRLGKMTEANYLSAVKATSARGWRRSEPVPLGSPEAPRRLRDYLHTPQASQATDALPREVIIALSLALETN